ncbi:MULTISPECIES: hypothetical protein [Solibacillus]|uniref:hypothetical protein n=1 Tax=Solibacillus TaxID=648800 RepID=UPI0007FB49D4|nr:MULTISPECIES: hypothetical protein [Solibacillus]OBW54747.1 hypothetical protein A9986_14085 [Solibacillus silvestris]
MLDKLEKTKGKIIVTSKFNVKLQETTWSKYIKVKRYENVVAFIKDYKRTISRTWNKKYKTQLQISDLILDEELYNNFTQPFILKEYALTTDQLYSPFYALITYKETGKIALIPASDVHAVDMKKLVSDVLCEYGYIDSIPKYQLKKLS